VCAGWSGTGDVPATGALNHVDLVPTQPSSLTWLWARELALTNRLRLADSGKYLGETVTWHRELTDASTIAAPELCLVSDQPYAFCGWRVDGARWPGDTGPAANPASGIPMTVPRQALGDYLPLWQDTDGNQLSDWWELRYFALRPTPAPPPPRTSTAIPGPILRSSSTTPTPATRKAPPFRPRSPSTPWRVQTQHPPWTVQADITDNLTVQQACSCGAKKGFRLADNTLATVSNTLYEAQLDPPSHGAKRVDYFVAACDLLGYYEPAFTAVSATNQVIGDYAYSWMTVSPDGFGTVELCAAPTNLSLTVANLAGPDLLWTARVSSAGAPFAASDSGWAHSGTRTPGASPPTAPGTGIPSGTAATPPRASIPTRVTRSSTRPPSASASPAPCCGGSGSKRNSRPAQASGTRRGARIDRRRRDVRAHHAHRRLPLPDRSTTPRPPSPAISPAWPERAGRGRRCSRT
jgi:hypothetical protein